MKDLCVQCKINEPIHGEMTCPQCTLPSQTRCPVTNHIKEHCEHCISFPMFKVIIAGSRTFNDYEVFKQYCDKVLINKLPFVQIISGMAKGADQMAIQYAKDKMLPLTKVFADWSTHGKSAGYRRNYEMLKQADGLIAFHVDQSKGTQHMIDITTKKGLPVKILQLKGGEK